MKYPRRLWVDLEATGLDEKNDYITEICCILELGDEFHFYHKYVSPPAFPDNYMMDGAGTVTGLTPEFLKAKGVSEGDFHRSFCHWLDGFVKKKNKLDKLVVCGKNVKYDANILRNTFIRQGDNYYGSYFFSIPMDIDSFMALLLSETRCDRITSFSLSKMCDFAGIENDGAHSARNDIIATGRVWKRLLQLLRDYNVINKYTEIPILAEDPAYDELHKYCPDCKSEINLSEYPNRKADQLKYVDKTKIKCDCEFKGIIHDLTPEPEEEKIDEKTEEQDKEIP